MQSMNDLKNTGKSLEESLELHSQRKGKEFANKIVTSTANGRGLWIFILWPAFLMITSVVASIISSFFGLSMLFAIPIGVVIAYGWYMSDYTISHPFWSGILGYVGPFIVIGLLLELNR